MDSIRKVHAIRWEGSASREDADRLVVEEPLEIRLAGTPVGVTMRTPGHDFELAAGFLYTEGILSRPGQVGAISYCDDPENPHQSNIVDVLPAEEVILSKGWQRSFYTTSSCGICGKASIEAVRVAAPRLVDDTHLKPESLYELPNRLRDAQVLFAETGALHGAALFTASGALEILREDVGRHNAVDKIIGTAFLAESLPLRGRLLLVSGRASFEIIQKALMAGIPSVAAISGVSTLAVELAQESGMALIGFLRGRSMQVYAGGERLRGS
jgi:FdhD protein